MIGSAAKLSFMDFLLNLAPVVLGISFVILCLMILIFRRDLQISDLNRHRILAMDEKKMIHNPVLMKKSLIVLSAVVIGFLVHGFIELEPSIIALAGACVLIVWSDEDLEDLLKKVEWDTILFFVGLFIMVGVLEYAGIIGSLADRMIALTGGNLQKTSFVLLFSSGIFSGILDNIPLVATFIPIVKIIGHSVGNGELGPVWWSLALGSCLGGNGTLVGASANVIMFGFAKKNNVDLSFGGVFEIRHTHDHPVTGSLLGLYSLPVLLIPLFLLPIPPFPLDYARGTEGK
jgi:Na+/H+ antiporter NhaD/arsenite permease-like protein